MLQLTGEVTLAVKYDYFSNYTVKGKKLLDMSHSTLVAALIYT